MTKSTDCILSVYRGTCHFENFFRGYAQLLDRDSVRLIVVHNSPEISEERVLRDHLSSVEHLYISTPRESLYSSWNRAIIASYSPFVTMWNIDDTRFPNSIKAMVDLLEQNPEIGWTYGNFLVRRERFPRAVWEVQTPNSSRENVSGGSIGGPFFMFRRSVIEDIGLFDEQFLCNGDHDFTLRLAQRFEGKRTPGIHGIFLDRGMGLSTTGFVQQVENEFINRRYGITRPVPFVSRSLSKLRDREMLRGHQYAPLTPYFEPPVHPKYRRSEGLISYMRRIFIFFARIIYIKCSSHFK